MNNFAFQKHLQQNVVEAYVSRRHKKTGWSDTRGIFATTNRAILNSIEGLKAFGFKSPNGIGAPFNPLEKNCVVCWDIFRGAYRNFSMDNGVNILRSFSVSNPSDVLKFWDFFSSYILKLSDSDKLKFMGKL